MEDTSLKTEVASLNLDLVSVVGKIQLANKELDLIKKQTEFVRQELKDVQLLKTPTIRDLDFKIESKSRELRVLEENRRIVNENFVAESASINERNSVLAKQTKCLENKQSSVEKELAIVAKKFLDTNELFLSKQKELKSLTKELDQFKLRMERDVGLLEQQKKELMDSISSIELREKSLKIKENESAKRDGEIFLKERALQIKEEVTNEMFQETKEKYKHVIHK